MGALAQRLLEGFEPDGSRVIDLDEWDEDAVQDLVSEHGSRGWYVAGSPEHFLVLGCRVPEEAVACIEDYFRTYMDMEPDAAELARIRAGAAQGSYISIARARRVKHGRSAQKDGPPLPE